MELRGVANSSLRQTHERRVLLISNHEGASFAFCAAFSRGGSGRPIARSLGVFTTGSPDSPAGRPDGPKVSHRLELRVSRGAGCRVKSGSVPLERSLEPASIPWTPNLARMLARRSPWTRRARHRRGGRADGSPSREIQAVSAPARLDLSPDLRLPVRCGAAWGSDRRRTALACPRGRPRIRKPQPYSVRLRAARRFVS